MIYIAQLMCQVPQSPGRPVRITKESYTTTVQPERVQHQSLPGLKTPPPSPAHRVSQHLLTAAFPAVSSGPKTYLYCQCVQHQPLPLPYNLQLHLLPSSSQVPLWHISLPNGPCTKSSTVSRGSCTLYPEAYCTRKPLYPKAHVPRALLCQETPVPRGPLYP